MHPMSKRLRDCKALRSIGYNEANEADVFIFGATKNQDSTGVTKAEYAAVGDDYEQRISAAADELDRLEELTEKVRELESRVYHLERTAGVFNEDDE